jgi:hypothetical protein
MEQKPKSKYTPQQLAWLAAVAICQDLNERARLYLAALKAKQ